MDIHHVGIHPNLTHVHRSPKITICKCLRIILVRSGAVRGAVGQRGHIINLVCTLFMHRQNITCLICTVMIMHFTITLQAMVSLTQCRYHVQLVLLEAKRTKGRSCESNPLYHSYQSRQGLLCTYSMATLAHCDTCDSAL